MGCTLGTDLGCTLGTDLGCTLGFPTMISGKDPSVHPQANPSVHPQANPSVHPRRQDPNVHPQCTPGRSPKRARCRIPMHCFGRASQPQCAPDGAQPLVCTNPSVHPRRHGPCTPTHDQPQCAINGHSTQQVFLTQIVTLYLNYTSRINCDEFRNPKV